MGSAKRFAYALIIASSLLGSSVYSQDSTFTITSYIPTHFTQWRWYVDGSLGGTESRPSDAVTARANSRLYMYSYTPQVFSRFSLSTGLAGALEKYDETHTSTYIPENYITDWEKRQQYSISVYPQVEYARFVKGNAFLSFIGEFEGGYAETSPDHRKMHTHQHVIGTLYENVGDSWTDDQNERIDRNWRFSGELMPGVGRVYEGSFAYTAISMINVLKKKNLLQRSPSAAEYASLCDTIQWYRKFRPIDSRDHRIVAIEAIVAYLVTQGIIAESDITAPVYLIDVWDYFVSGVAIGSEMPPSSTVRPSSLASSGGRPFGWRIRVGCGGFYQRYETDRSQTFDYYSSYTQFHSTDSTLDTSSVVGHDRYIKSTDSKQEEYESFIRCGVEWYRPLSFHWQASASLVASSYFQTGNNSKSEVRTYDLDSSAVSVSHDSTSNTEHDRYDMSTNLALDYIFDYRNSIRLAVVHSVEHSQVGRGENSSRGTHYDLSVSTAYRWRLAVPTNLGVTVTYVRYNQNITSTRPSTTARLNYSIKLTHYLI